MFLLILLITFELRLLDNLITYIINKDLNILNSEEINIHNLKSIFGYFINNNFFKGE